MSSRKFNKPRDSIQLNMRQGNTRHPFPSKGAEGGSITEAIKKDGDWSYTGMSRLTSSTRSLSSSRAYAYISSRWHLKDSDQPVSGVQAQPLPLRWVLQLNCWFSLRVLRRRNVSPPLWHCRRDIICRSVMMSFSHSFPPISWWNALGQRAARERRDLSECTNHHHSSSPSWRYPNSAGEMDIRYRSPVDRMLFIGSILSIAGLW